jgi:CRP/FNR family cyclic AMP-dependent transcriptional regulator
MQLSTEDLRSRFPFLTKHTSSEEIGALIDSLLPRQHDAGEIILRDGKPNDSLFLVWDGELTCYIEHDNEKVQIGQITPGQYIGEVSIIDPGNATATVEAITPCKLLELTRINFTQLEKDHPVIASKLIRALDSVLIERLRTSDEFLFKIFSQENLDTSLSETSTKKTEWFTKLYQRLIGGDVARS